MKADRLLALWHWERWIPHFSTTGIWKAVFACNIEGHAPTESLEIDWVDFFGLDDLPPLSEPRMTEAGLRRLMDAYRTGRTHLD